jgi:tRNA uridine 5-carbamoylmethylation protein Kti12
MPLSDKQKRFVELERKKDEVKKYYEDLEKATAELIAEQGLNSYFQDAEGTVYKLVELDGRFVKFDRFGYVRTKRAGEERGSLSMKEAKERGFAVE